MRCLSCVLLALMLVCWQESGRTAEGSLREDRRLQAPISVYRESILLGDLLALVSDKTGAQIRTSPSDAAMGSIELTIGGSETPAWKLMDGIRSLHLSSLARWEWTGDGSPGAPYTLACSHSTARLKVLMREALREQFAAHVDLMIKAADLLPAEREALAGRYPELRNRLQTERGVLGVQLFAALPGAIREQVLVGKRVMLRTEELPRAGQELVRKRWESAAARNPGNPLFQGEPPRQIMIDADTVPGNLAPMIFITAGQLGGHSYFGGSGFEARLKELDESIWRKYSDKESLPNGSQKPDAARSPAGGQSKPAASLPAVISSGSAVLTGL